MKIKLTDFFKNDYVDQASYDNLRKIASLVDGQKNASRKILYTILEKTINTDIKVSQLGSKVSEFAEYLHGTMDGVIVGLAQNYPGTNNMPLLVREGNFGTRFTPEASASRYIYTHGSDEFFELFNKEDSKILVQQFFEGVKIEPMYFTPTLPLLLINGSEGVSSGFAQKILSRNTKDIKKYIKNSLLKKSTKTVLIPHYNSFNGVIEQGEHSSQWLIKGLVERVSINKVKITEVPVGYDLRSYLKVLDDLEDKKVIRSYVDKSENDEFLFEVSINSKDLKSWNDETLLTKLKLIKKVTENYTVIDENNKIVVFNNVNDILDQYIRIKLASVQDRKSSMLADMSSSIEIDTSKYKFIEMIVTDKLIINKRKKLDIIKDIDNVSEIHQKDGSYDYLLQMNIMSLTTERMAVLKTAIDSRKAEYAALQSQTPESIWQGEL